jgi:hypothetical protein
MNLEENLYPRIKIPSENIDYREVARLMRINIDILKKELTDHVNNEIERFQNAMNEESSMQDEL